MVSRGQLYSFIDTFMPIFSLGLWEKCIDLILVRKNVADFKKTSILSPHTPGP